MWYNAVRNILAMANCFLDKNMCLSETKGMDIIMTREQYEKLSKPFRNHEMERNVILTMDKILTVLIFAAYPVLLVWLWYEMPIKELLKCIFVPGVSFLLVSAFRALYSAPRPYEKLDIQPLIPKETKGKSFPSRHVFSTFMIGMTFFYVYKPLGIGIGIIGLLMGFIRVAGGVHFPKDVAAGAIIGILCGMLYFV